MSMKVIKSNALKGQNNKRLNNVDEIHNEATAAWSDNYEVAPKTHVSTPSTDAVINAKEWVDNGSKL